MTFLLGKQFNSFVELFVFLFRFFLLEFLDFVLLLKEFTFNFSHMCIIFKHFSEEIIRSRYWDLGLYKNLHTLHDILPSIIIKSNFSFNVIIDVEFGCSISNNYGFFIGDTHMLGKWNTPMLLNQLLRFKSVIKVLLHLMESIINLIQVVDAALTELRELNFLVVFGGQVLKILLILIFLLIVGCHFHITVN